MNFDTYPTATTERVTYPIQRLGAMRAADIAEAMLNDGGALYALRNALAHAKLDMLQAMLREDVVRVAGRDRVTIEIRLEREVVTREAFPQPGIHSVAIPYFGERPRYITVDKHTTRPFIETRD